VDDMLPTGDDLAYAELLQSFADQDDEEAV
jgi:hypothetical protein